MKRSVAIVSAVLLCGTPTIAQTAAAQERLFPPASDTPEEVLQTQVITSARSPIDNKPLTATQYAEVQMAIRQGNQAVPQLSPALRSIVASFKLRKFIKTTLPFIPIR